MRDEYDRNRLEYLYSQFKSHEKFTLKIKTHVEVPQGNTGDSAKEMAKINVDLCRIRANLDEFKEKSKKVQEEWAISSNGILSMSANALRKVEIFTRDDIEKLEDKLLQLRGHLPSKDNNGPPGDISSSEDGSDTSDTDQDPFAHERSPHRPRKPIAQTHLRSASKGGKRIDYSSTGDSVSSTVLSESIDELIRSYGAKNVPSPFFLPATTYRDPGKVQHGVERNDARTKRQGLGPETVSDLSMAKSDKMTENSESFYGCRALDPNTMATELRTNSTLSSSISSSEQTSSGVGSAKYQESYGSREITESAQQVNSEKQSQRSWVQFNDSLSMREQPSSSIRGSPRVGSQPPDIKFDFSTPFDRLIRPFERTKRDVARPESAPAGTLKTKPGISDISRAMQQQESMLGQPELQEPVQNDEHPPTRASVSQVSLRDMPQMNTSTMGTDETLTGDYEESEIHTTKDTEYEDRKVRTNTMRDLSEYTDQELEAAQALVDMSRSGTDYSDSQQQGVDHSRTESCFLNETHPSEMPCPSAYQAGAQYGGLQYGGSVFNAAAQYNNHNSMPSGYGSYSQGYAQHYGTAPPYGFSQPPSVMYTMGPHTGPVHPTFYHGSFQQGYQTGGHPHLPHMDHGSHFGAVGSEMGAMNEQSAQEEQRFVRSQRAPEQKGDATMDNSMQANNDPFVG